MRPNPAQRRALLSMAAGAVALAALGMRATPRIDAATVPSAVWRVDDDAKAMTATYGDSPRDATRERVAQEGSVPPTFPPDLRVRVEGEPDRCRAVPLALAVLQRDFAAAVVAQATTDAAGVARLPHRGRGAGLQVVDFDFPNSGAWAQAIDPTHRETTLFLPELGALRVVVVDEGDQPLLEPATLHATVLDASPPADRRHAWSVAGGAGCFLVEAAGLEIELRAIAGDGRTSAPVRVSGPARAGEVKECHVRLSAPPMLRARLFDALGQPLAQARVEIRFADSGVAIAEGIVAGAGGVVAFRAPRSPETLRWARLACVARDVTGQGWLGRASIDLHAGSAAPCDVYLAPPALLVAGRCVDCDGRSRSGLRLRVQVEGPAAVDKSGQRRVQWLDLPTAMVDTAADGTFRVLGFAEPDQRLRLVVTGAAVTPLPFVAGADALVVRVSGRTGWPRARLAALPSAQ